MQYAQAHQPTIMPLSANANANRISNTRAGDRSIGFAGAKGEDMLSVPTV